MSRVYELSETVADRIAVSGNRWLIYKEWFSMEFGDFSTDLDLAILEPVPGQPSSIPSLLGRDSWRIRAVHGLRTNRVLFLDAEADRLGLQPYGV